MTAITVAIDDNQAEMVQEQWEAFEMSVPLDILESPYRDLTHTVLDFLDQFELDHSGDVLTVVIPEAVVAPLVAGHLPQPVGSGAETSPLRRKNTVVVSIPYQLDEARVNADQPHETQPPRATVAAEVGRGGSKVPTTMGSR